MNNDSVTPDGPDLQLPPAPPSPPTAPTAAVTPAEANDPEPQASAPAGPARRVGPRTGPIVWGALILAFCAYVAQRTFGSGPLDSEAWLTATIIGLGFILLGVGAVVIIRNRRARP